MHEDFPTSYRFLPYLVVGTPQLLSFAPRTTYSTSDLKNKQWHLRFASSTVRMGIVDTICVSTIPLQNGPK